MVRVIRKQLVKRTLDMLKELSERAPNEDGKSDYNTLWEAFGRNIKLGCIEDPGNRELLAPLLRFPSSKSGEEVTGLGDYISRCASPALCHRILACQGGGSTAGPQQSKSPVSGRPICRSACHMLRLLAA